MTDDIGARLGAWLPLVRSADIPAELKLAALVFASYANADGTHITCSRARFAMDLRVDLRTAGRRLQWLRDAGLVEMTQRGNRRRGLADEYRLTVTPDVTMKYLEAPNPEEYKRQIGELSEANRRGAAARMRAKRERDRSVTDSLKGAVTTDPDGPVDNPEATESVTDTPDGSNSEVLRTDRQSVTDTPNSLTCEDVTTPPISTPCTGTKTFHVAMAEPSLERSGSSDPQDETHTDLQEVAGDFDATLAEARDVLSRLEDRGVALRAAVRAELGADAPPDEVILLAYERARRRRAG